MFSKKATNIDKTFTVDLTVTKYCHIDSEDFGFVVGFLENVNFNPNWHDLKSYTSMRQGWKFPVSLPFKVLILESIFSLPYFLI